MAARSAGRSKYQRSSLAQAADDCLAPVLPPLLPALPDVEVPIGIPAACPWAWLLQFMCCAAPCTCRRGAVARQGHASAGIGQHGSAWLPMQAAACHYAPTSPRSCPELARFTLCSHPAQICRGPAGPRPVAPMGPLLRCAPHLHICTCGHCLSASWQCVRCPFR